MTVLSGALAVGVEREQRGREIRTNPRFGSWNSQPCGRVG